MAYNDKSLVRIGSSGRAAGQPNGTSLYLYSTADALGTSAGQVEQAGYFNNARNRLHEGDAIMVVAAIGGSQAGAMLHVTDVPASGNVTVAAFRDAT